MANLTGKIINGRFQVIDSLGRGGMAEVYKVWDRERSVEIAMKVLRQDIAQDPIFLRRFQREAHSLSSLQHPNIVRFYGLERDGLLAFLLMEYVEGYSLQAEILLAEGKPLAGQRILEILKPVCAALSYAHKQGLVHCDLKPGNILIEPGGRVLLTDFGIARGMDSATSTMVGIGTPAYMAPEVIKGEDPGPQTDIYSLGVVLYEMLTGGERPFIGEKAGITGATAEKVRWEHLRLAPPPPSAYNPGVSADMDQVIGICLAKEPRARFASALDVLAAARAALGERPQEKESPAGTVEEPKAEPKAREEAQPQGRQQAPEGSSIPQKAPMLQSERPQMKYGRGPDPYKAGGLKGAPKILWIILALGLLACLIIPTVASRNNLHAAQTSEARTTTVTSYYIISEGQDLPTHEIFNRELITLYEDESNDSPECQFLDYCTDFVLEFSAKNPQGLSNGFDYGVLFRNEGGVDQLWLRFDLYSWELGNSEGVDSSVIARGSHSSFETSEGAINRIKLIVNGPTGNLFINGQFVSEFVLSDRLQGDMIWICTDMMRGSGTEGNFIDFYDITLQRILY